jgi:hypothetical protein
MHPGVLLKMKEDYQSKLDQRNKREFEKARDKVK